MNRGSGRLRRGSRGRQPRFNEAPIHESGKWLSPKQAMEIVGELQ